MSSVSKSKKEECLFLKRVVCSQHIEKGAAVLTLLLSRELDFPNIGIAVSLVAKTSIIKLLMNAPSNLICDRADANCPGRPGNCTKLVFAEVVND